MKIIHFDKIDSTNKYLIDNYCDYVSFTFVDASYQTAGKGRNDRKWLANKNESLLFSLLIKEKSLVNKYSLLSICSASIIYETLTELGIKNVSVKWPNDVYVNDKKICGILLQGSVPNYLVIGVGVNVNQKVFNGEYRVTPTSIYLETNLLINLNDLKMRIYEKFISIENRIDELIELAIKNDYTKGKEITIDGKTFLSLGINKDGSVKLKDNENELDICSGEIALF